VRLLAIETSSVRGSVALAEGLGVKELRDKNEVTVCALEHQGEHGHGESLLPMIEQALAVSGWNRRQLDRVAVGIGPGSFTGLRVGIALAQGLSEGLDIPLVGVPSLQAMALAVPRERKGRRCVLLDARRGEAFLAAYDEEGREALEVRLVAELADILSSTSELSEALFIGDATASFPGLPSVYRSSDTDLPHARWTALAALDTAPPAVIRPLYVRDAGAVVPRLPPALWRCRPSGEAL
jgi:tRNA threonylcarbamoyladenosine biosynthesis protein TsaB